MKITPFPHPVYITRPILPRLDILNERLSRIWQLKCLTNYGEQHKALESGLQEHLKVPYLSLFNNGTVALLVALRALGLSQEVITTPFTFPATPHVLAWSGIAPVFCDIDARSMNIDVEKIESMITPRTTGILAVHVFGLPCNVEGIKKIADRHGLKVIYDAAHAFGTEISGKGIGGFGDVTMFSFHATKLFHTAEGGALSVAEDGLKNQIDLLRNFGIRGEEAVLIPGINGKMNEIQAALGLAVLDCIEAEKENRKILRDIYVSRLKDIPGIHLMEDPPKVKPNYSYFVIRISERDYGLSRDDVYRRFREYNVFARKYFYPLGSNYPCYRTLPSSDPVCLPVANRVAKEVLCLPFYGELDPGSVNKICDILMGMKR